MIPANDIGPIARKIIAAGRKQQRQQIVDLQAVRGARDQMRRIIDEAIPSSDVGDHLGPRRKRRRRPARLIAAVTWRSGYGGKNLVRGYARWFGVDPICAITELPMLGVAVNPEYEAQLRRTIAARAGWRARRRAEQLAAKTRPIEIEWPDDWPAEWIPSEPDTEAALDDIPF